MQNTTQPFVNLSTANAELITRFSQSQEMVDLVNGEPDRFPLRLVASYGGSVFFSINPVNSASCCFWISSNSSHCRSRN